MEYDLEFDKLVVTDASFNTWKLVEDLNVKTSQGIFTVPKGFITDFATVPRLLTWLVPKTGRYTKASVLHDWFCVNKEYNRKFGDYLFYEKMLDYGTYKWKAKIIYWSVRLYAIVTFKK